jgi:hypothetical protein
MITRKKFIKLSSISALAIGSGYTVSKLLDNPGNQHYSVYCFLPSDEKLFAEVVRAFITTVKSNSIPIINADDDYKFMLQKLLRKHRQTSFSNSGSVSYSVKRLNKHVNSDIIVSDTNKSIYSLKNDFTDELMTIRSLLYGTEAKIFFAAVYKQSNILASLFSSNQKEIVIENKNGTFDKIPLSSTYKSIIVDGPQGETEIEINKGLVKVTKSTCRHKLCEKSHYAANVGDVIACAPNKVLIRIEEV